jgi:hypothetical protein
MKRREVRKAEGIGTVKRMGGKRCKERVGV